MSLFYVQIIEASTDKIVECLGPMSESRAEKVERGASINLNHEDYFTRQVSEQEHAGCGVHAS